ncbi:MAG TPA: hypothetical protein QGI71_10680 [Dehalococcoidia bacterium]|jgi:hypothetical protein|nr:hypothetical protein [Dehalococcoidia bacterium]
MNKGQAIADLSLELTAVITIERAQEILEKALASPDSARARSSTKVR